MVDNIVQVLCFVFTSTFQRPLFQGFWPVWTHAAPAIPNTQPAVHCNATTPVVVHRRCDLMPIHGHRPALDRWFASADRDGLELDLDLLIHLTLLAIWVGYNVFLDRVGRACSCSFTKRIAVLGVVRSSYVWDRRLCCLLRRLLRAMLGGGERRDRTPSPPQCVD